MTLNRISADGFGHRSRFIMRQLLLYHALALPLEKTQVPCRYLGVHLETVLRSVELLETSAIFSKLAKTSLCSLPKAASYYELRVSARESKREE